MLGQLILRTTLESEGHWSLCVGWSRGGENNREEWDEIEKPNPDRLYIVPGQDQRLISVRGRGGAAFGGVDRRDRTPYRSNNNGWPT